VLTAVREANQVGNLQPTTLVSYDAEIEAVFDSRDEAALQAEGMDAAALADASWRDQMKASGEARTQAFARNLIARAIPHCSYGALPKVPPSATSISCSGNGAMRRRHVSP
jgi:hypothetical protein